MNEIRNKIGLFKAAFNTPQGKAALDDLKDDPKNRPILSLSHIEMVAHQARFELIQEIIDSVNMSEDDIKRIEDGIDSDFEV